MAQQCAAPIALLASHETTDAELEVLVAERQDAFYIAEATHRLHVFQIISNRTPALPHLRVWTLQACGAEDDPPPPPPPQALATLRCASHRTLHFGTGLLREGGVTNVTRELPEKGEGACSSKRCLRIQVPLTRSLNFSVGKSGGTDNKIVRHAWKHQRLQARKVHATDIARRQLGLTREHSELTCVRR